MVLTRVVLHSVGSLDVLLRIHPRLLDECYNTSCSCCSWSAKLLVGRSKTQTSFLAREKWHRVEHYYSLGIWEIKGSTGYCDYRQRRRCRYLCTGLMPKNICTASLQLRGLSATPAAAEVTLWCLLLRLLGSQLSFGLNRRSLVNSYTDKPVRTACGEICSHHERMLRYLISSLCS